MADGSSTNAPVEQPTETRTSAPPNYTTLFRSWLLLREFMEAKSRADEIESKVSELREIIRITEEHEKAREGEPVNTDGVSKC